MGFSEILQSLQNPGDDGVPDTIYDDLTAEYNSVVEGGAASAAEHESVVSQLTDEIGRLKALNFDLLVSAGVNDAPETPSDDSDDEPESPTIDDLFE